MRRALVMLVLVSFGALASPSKKRSPPLKWRCTWQGSRVFCDLEGRRLTSQPTDRVFLFDRTAPEFASLVVAPASFEPFVERLSGQ